MAGAGSTRKACAPGRVARSVATIVLKPVNGSIRTSGKRPLHADVLDPRRHERVAALRVAGGAVEPAGPGLGVEHDALRPGGSGLLLAQLEQAPADAPLPGVAVDDEPAQPAGRPLEQQPAGADDGAALERDEVEGVAVAAVDLLLPRDALFVAEHANAELDCGGALGRIAGAAKRDGRGGGAHRRKLPPRATGSPAYVPGSFPRGPSSPAMGVCWRPYTACGRQAEGRSQLPGGAGISDRATTSAVP